MKALRKISSIKIGSGGYDDAMFGVTICVELAQMFQELYPRESKYDEYCRRFPRAAKKSRNRNKWRNRFGEVWRSVFSK